MSPSEFKAHRTRARLTQKEAADRLGVSRSLVAQYEIGGVRIPEEAAAKARQWTAEVAEEMGVFARVAPAPTGRLAMLGLAQAGLDAYDPPSDGEAAYIAVPMQFVRADYGALEATGTSMTPYIHPGDVLIFRERRELLMGKVNLALMEGRRLVKVPAWTADGVVLASWNPHFEAIPADGAVALGYLVGVIAGNGTFAMGPFEQGIDRLHFEAELMSRLPLQQGMSAS